MFLRKFCESCAQLKPHRFNGTQNFLDYLQLFQSLLENGSFEFISSDFELEHPKNADGCWQDDIMECTIRCKVCGRKYCCSCDTYHGHGSLSKIR